VLLAPHLLGPASSGAVLDTASDLVQKMQSSWGRLASEGFCSGLVCARFPVVAGKDMRVVVVVVVVMVVAARRG